MIFFRRPGRRRRPNPHADKPPDGIAGGGFTRPVPRIAATDIGSIPRRLTIQGTALKVFLPGENTGTI
jgi:hypothetical protein